MKAIKWSIDLRKPRKAFQMEDFQLGIILIKKNRNLFI